MFTSITFFDLARNWSFINTNITILLNKWPPTSPDILSSLVRIDSSRKSTHWHMEHYTPGSERLHANSQSLSLSGLWWWRFSGSTSKDILSLRGTAPVQEAPFNVQCHWGRLEFMCQTKGTHVETRHWMDEGASTMEVSLRYPCLVGAQQWLKWCVHGMDVMVQMSIAAGAPAAGNPSR